MRSATDVVDRMALLLDDEELRIEHLPPKLAGVELPRSHPEQPPETCFAVSELLPLEQVEADYLRWAEARVNDRASLARALGVPARTIYRKRDSARRSRKR